MKPVFYLILTGALAVGSAMVGYHYGLSAPNKTDATTQPSADDVTAVPSVQTDTIRQGTLTEKIIAYGPVQAEASDVSITSVPFEIRVKRVLVRPGQPVEAGAPLCNVEPSPDTQLQLSQAQVAMDAATKDLAQTQQRFNDHLATSTDLLTAQGNLQTAKLKLDSMLRAGAAGSQELKAATGGIVSKVDVQEGQIVAAGGGLVEVAAGNKIEARLGVEPENIGDIHVGDPVTLTAVGAESPTPITGKVALVSQRINPDTRLVDVVVSLPPQTGLLLESYVRAELPGDSATGLIVPRKAVLPADEGLHLFTVKDGKAVEHAVTVTLENDDEAVVSGDGMAAGDAVVVVGNYELEDGNSVTVESPSTEASTEPSTEPSTRETAP